MKKSIGLLLFVGLVLLAVWPLVPVGQAGNPNDAVKSAKRAPAGRTLRASDDLVQPNSAGLPNILNEKAPLSTTVMTFLGGRNAAFNDVTLLADFSGRENYIADRGALLQSFTGTFTDPDATIARTAISAHSVANGFAENVFYYGDTAGNLYVGTDINPQINPGPGGSVDNVRTINIPALVNTGTSGGFTLPAPSDCADDEVAITGIAVNPVADLSDFGVACNTIGEIVYVSILDTEGCGSNAANQPNRTRIFAFAFSDGVGVNAATPVGVLQIFRSPLSNTSIALDDDGSLYFHLVDLTQNLGGAIFKVTELPHVTLGCPATPRVNRAIINIPTVGLTSVTPLSNSSARVTNYSSGNRGAAGTITPTFGNIVSIATGPGNIVYAALARSFVASDDAATQNTEGRFTNPSALGATPSMIISFSDAGGSGTSDTCSQPTSIVPGAIPIADGYSDGPSATATRTVGVNNFRVFALGTGPDIRPVTPATSLIATSSTLKLAMQIDPTIYAGLTVDEQSTVYVVSGGTPSGLGTNPSPTLGEVMAFQDSSPGDRRADFVDFRGDTFPGTNVGDGDSDRFDHIYWQAPNDGSGNPSGIGGLARGFLRYTNRLAPTAISPGVTLGQTTAIQGDDDTAGPIIFEGFDPSHQAAGGDDQNAPFRGDDSDGLSNPATAGNPTAPGAQAGGFEFVFGNGRVWNAFFLNSNGSITFNGGDTNNIPTVAALYSGLPRIAPAWADFNPNARAVNPGDFPVQAIGFSGINAFKIRYINVPEFGFEGCTAAGPAGASNNFSLTLSDDGTGRDENANQALNAGNNKGDNATAFDLLEGPTDLRFVKEPTTNTLVGVSPRPDGSGYFTFDYGRMDILGVNSRPITTGYSAGGGAITNPPGVCEVNLSEAARAAENNAPGVIQGQTASVSAGLLGEGTEPAIFEFFSEGNDAAVTTEGAITTAVPSYDLRNESNDPALATPVVQTDLNRGRIAFRGFGLPPVPLANTVIAGTFVVPPNQPSVPINALGTMDVFVVGSGFYPNEVTTVCQGFPEQRTGKTVTTAMTLAIDNNADAVADSTFALGNVQVVNENLVKGTLLPVAGFPGTPFPLAAFGPDGVITTTATFSAGDNNAFGSFTRPASASFNVGKRAPVVQSVTPALGDCGATQNIVIGGAWFKQGDGATANVTSVFAVDQNNSAVSIPATSFSITNTNSINASFNFPAGSGGKSFLIFTNGPNGTSRNMLTLPGGTPAGVPTGNEAGNIIRLTCGETFQFSSASYSITEDCAVAPITITRGVAGPAASSVTFATSDGTALQKSDYTATFRTVTFAAGETSKTVEVPITEDSFVEGNETVNVTLSSPVGGALGAQTTAVLTINNDDPAPPAGNPIDDTTTFVGQQYHDFFDRQGDASGVAFWIGTITSCGANTACIEQRRIAASAAFFLSVEFQETGYNVIRSQRVAFGKQSANPATRYPYLSFLKDAQQVGAGVIIGQPGADALLEANKQAYATQIVTSAGFITAYPLAQTASQYVDALFATAAVTPTTAERNAAIAAFGGGGTSGRVAAFRSVVDSNSVRSAEFNAAFVLMEYYGYLRRNPTDAPDNNDAGYQFWLTKLNSFGGNFINAEMVKGFLNSIEYRQRFGNP